MRGYEVMNRVPWVRRFTVGLMVALLAISGVNLGSPKEARAQGDLAAGIMAGAAAAGVEIGTGVAQFAADNVDKVCPGGQEDLVNCAIAFVQLGAAADECFAEAEEAGGEDGADLQTFTDCLGDNGFGIEPEDEDDSSNDDLIDYSMYRVAASVSAMYFNALSPFSDEDSDQDSSGDDDDDSISLGGGGGDSDGGVEDAPVLDRWSKYLGTASSGGSFMGYPDEKYGVHDRFIFSEGGSQSDVMFSHGSLARPGAEAGADDDAGKSAAFGRGGGYRPSSADTTGRPDVGVANYAVFGSTLAGMGLDTTATRSEAKSAGTIVGGGSIMIAYALSGAVDAIFDSVIGVLRFLNPFSFLVDAVAEETNPTFTQGMASEQNDDGLFDSIKDFIGKLYRGVIQVGWFVTVPIFIGVVVFGAMFMRRYDTGKGVKQLLIRMAFLVIGLPLLGVTYTGALDSMGGGPETQTSSNATKVVLSTYVDFENWINGSRLYIPKGSDIHVEWDPARQAPSDRAEARARQTSLAINTMAPQWSSLSESTVSEDDGTKWVSHMSDSDKGADAASSGESFVQTMQMLMRFVGGDQISATDYASVAQGSMADKARENEDSLSLIRGWYEQLLDPRAMAEMDQEAIDEMVNPLISVAPGRGLQATTLQSKSADDEARDVVLFESDPDGHTSTNCTPDVVATRGWDGSSEDASDVLSMCNMAPLAVFNYLNTSFTPSGGTMFSADKAVSVEARQQHNSVSAVGSGMMRLVYWFSSITLLASFVIIGLLYALALLVGSIKRLLSVLGSSLFATMGILPAIAKVVTHTAALFIEIIGTIFLYKIVQEFLMVVPGIFERMFLGALDSPEQQAAGGYAMAGLLSLGAKSPTTTVMVISLLTSAGVILFTFMAMRFRSSMIGAVDDALTRLVNKLTDSQVSSGSSAGGATRQAVAKGAGLAATSMMLNAGGAGDVSGEVDGESAVGSAAGAGGVAAGDGDGGGDGGSGSVMGGDPTDDGGGGGGMVADEDGNLYDAAGNPVEDPRGGQLGVDDVASVDANGNLVDAAGNPVLDANGEAISSGSVGGIASDGTLVGTDGRPLTDAHGNAINASGASGSAGVKSLSDETVAAQVAAQGGLTQPGEGAEATESTGGNSALVGAGAAAAGAAAMSGGGGGASVNLGGTSDVSGGGGGGNSRVFGSTTPAGVAGAAAGHAAGAAVASGAAGASAASSSAAAVNVTQAASQLPGAAASLRDQYIPAASGTPGAPGAAAPATPAAGPSSFGNAPVVGGGAPVTPGYQPVAAHVPTAPAGGVGNTARLVGASMAGSMISQGLANSRNRNIDESINGGKGGGGRKKGSGAGAAAAGGAMQGMARSMGGPGTAAAMHVYGAANRRGQGVQPGGRPGGQNPGQQPPAGSAGGGIESS